MNVMNELIEDIKDQVIPHDTVIGGTVVLVQEIAKEIVAMSGDPEALRAFAKALTEESIKLGCCVTVNTCLSSQQA